MFHLRSASKTAFISLSAPLPCLAESVMIDRPRMSGRMPSSTSCSFLRLSTLSSTRSHLFMASTMARPSREIRSHNVRSCFSMGIDPSTNTTTHSAYLTARKPSDTDSFSNFSLTLALRRIPAVSHSLISRPPQCQSDEIASRVMPASGPVNIRSSPSREFTSVDLPALGWPIIASFNGFAGRSGASTSGSNFSSTSTSSAFAFLRSFTTSGFTTS